MRIAFVRSKSDGGIEPRLLREARVLAQAGHDVHVVLWDRTGTFPEEEGSFGIAVHRVHLRAPYNRLMTAVRLLDFWEAARFVLAQIGPDVVHVCDLDTLSTTKNLDVPVVFDAWDFWSLMLTRRLVRPFRGFLWNAEKRYIAEADRVILPMAERARAFDRPLNFVEITNSPEEEMRPFPTSHDSTVAYVGLIAGDRGLVPLARGCALAKGRLIVAGSGPDERSILPKLARAGTRCIGHIWHVAALAIEGSADIVAALYDPRIVNNRWAAPNKLFEAMMLGKPILALRGTLIADFVYAHDIGFVVPSLEPKAIALILRSAFAQPELMEEMGTRGRALYEERYTWATMARRLVDLYRSIEIPSNQSLRAKVTW